MPTPFHILLGLIFLTAMLLLMIALRPELTRERGGKMLAFVALFLLPLIVGFMSLDEHMERSKKTEFCLSCHVMEDYGKSLYVDDGEYLAASHFQNKRIPTEKACYSCHTEYTMYGNLNDKLRGIKHVIHQYFGDITDSLHLYDPYNNRECLHCHQGSRAFETQLAHLEEELMMDSLKNGSVSCLQSGCHDVIHNTKELAEQDVWSPNEETMVLPRIHKFVRASHPKQEAAPSASDSTTTTDSTAKE